MVHEHSQHGPELRKWLKLTFLLLSLLTFSSGVHWACTPPDHATYSGEDTRAIRAAVAHFESSASPTLPHRARTGKIVLVERNSPIEGDGVRISLKAGIRRWQLERSLLSRNRLASALSSARRSGLALRKRLAPDIRVNEVWPDTRCLVAPAAPGYSRDGNYCVVFMTIEPPVYGSYATYVLQLEDGAWEVLDFLVVSFG